MANEAALHVLGRAGTEAVVEATSHFVDWELGAPAMLSGVQLRPVAAADGLLTAALVEAAIRPGIPFQVRTSVVCVENTHNASGGRIMPLEAMRAIRAITERRGVPVHLDGARLWNAAATTGIPEAAFAACADTVMVTLSKGLGCPVGSLLAGPTDAVAEARIFRRRVGGAMRQSGILAAAGLYALEHHRERLREDHVRAAQLAAIAGDIPGLVVVAPESNIVMIEVLAPELDAAAVVAGLASRGVLMVVFTTRRFRAVTHLDVDDGDIARAAEALVDVLRTAA
jgi:threonine aldolase